MARTFAIGDIHGCIDALDALLDRIQPTQHDTIIFLGDYIDRGPDSAEVVRRVMALRDDCQVVSLQGNHEAMMLMAKMDASQMNFWLSYGGRETLESYGKSIDDVPQEHLDFLNECPLYHETANHIFVHANFTPSLPMEKQPEFALLWEHLSVHLPDRHKSGKRAVLGHTPQPSGDVLFLDQLICIDTHCYGDGYLTAINIDDESVLQADKHGVMRGEAVGGSS